MSIFQRLLSRNNIAATSFIPQASNDRYENAIVVATFPRSGTTWMINSLISLYEPVQEAEINSWLFTKSIQDLGNGYKLSFKEDRNSRFTIIKTHMNWLDFTGIDLRSKVVYIYRHPADVMISYYFYTQHWIWNRKEEEVVFDESEFTAFLRKTLPEWVEHVNSWAISNKSLESERVFLVQYEEMKNSFNKTMNNVASFINTKRTKTIAHCREKVLAQQFGNTNSSFFRKGTCGDWKNYFTQHHSEITDSIAESAMRELGYKPCSL